MKTEEFRQTLTHVAVAISSGVSPEVGIITSPTLLQ